MKTRFFEDSTFRFTRWATALGCWAVLTKPILTGTVATKKQVRSPCPLLDTEGKNDSKHPTGGSISANTNRQSTDRQLPTQTNTRHRRLGCERRPHSGVGMSPETFPSAALDPHLPTQLGTQAHDGRPRARLHHSRATTLRRDRSRNIGGMSP